MCFSESGKYAFRAHIIVKEQPTWIMVGVAESGWPDPLCLGQRPKEFRSYDLVNKGVYIPPLFCSRYLDVTVK